MLEEKIKKLRNDRGIYQRELAEKLNCSVQSISSYEKGTKRPSRETLNKLADFYGVTTDYLLGRENNNKFSPKITAISKELEKLPPDELELIHNLIKKLNSNRKD